MEFKYKSPAEFEALSEYQKEKYLDEKQKHETKVAEDRAEKAAQKVIGEMKAEAEAAHGLKLKEIEDKNEEKLKELADKYSQDLEAMKAQLKLAKIGEVNERMKDMVDEITEKFSTPEGEAMLKAFLAGQKEKLNLDIEAKAVFKAPMTVPANGVAPQFTPIVGPGHDDFHARDVIPVFPTVADVIRYVQFTIDPAADGIGTVPEAGQKPNMGYISSVQSAVVYKIAGLLDVSDEMMEDVVGFRAWLAYELPKAYMDVEDQKIFKGTGVDDILGLWYQADPQTFPFGTVTAGSNNWDKIIAGITEVRTRKRATSAVFVSPIDYMELWINKGTTEEYTYPIVMDSNGILRVGGVPVFWSNTFEYGEGLVGDFARGTAIFQRKAMNIRFADQHVDNFGKNIVTIRIEGREALPIYFPDAFLKLFNGTT